MTLTQQSQHLKLETGFYILFPAKGIASYRKIISGHLYIYLKGSWSLAGHALLSTDE